MKSKKVKFPTVAESDSEDNDIELIEGDPQIDDLGYIPVNTLPEEFETALQDLKAGGVTEILHTSQGYHILKLIDKVEGRVPPLSEVLEKINLRLREKKEKQYYRKFMADYNKKNKITIKEEYFEKKDSE